MSPRKMNLSQPCSTASASAISNAFGFEWASLIIAYFINKHPFPPTYHVEVGEILRKNLVHIQRMSA